MQQANCLCSTESLSQRSPDSQASSSFVDFLLLQPFPSLFHVTFSICIPSGDLSLLLPRPAVSNTSVLVIHSLPAALLWRTGGGQTRGRTSHHNHAMKYFWLQQWPHGWKELWQQFCPTPSAMEQVEIRDWLLTSSSTFCNTTLWL